MDESLPPRAAGAPPLAPPIALEDLPRFTPVPSTRTRHDGWTAQRRRDFLLVLARLGLVAPAARSVGMSARTAYRLRARDRDGSFTTAWDEAVEDGRRAAISTGVARAIDGVLVPVYYHGRKVGEQRRYGNRLLIAALYATISPAERAAFARATVDGDGDGDAQ